MKILEGLWYSHIESVEHEENVIIQPLHFPIDKGLYLAYNGISSRELNF